MSVCGHVYVNAEGPLGLESEITVNHLTWLLGIKLGASGKVANANY